jgi:shikimate kinase
MNIILTGFMGTGKTAVGKRLARRLGWSFVDVDRLIEAGAKMPIARIFSERGERVFRRLEQRQLGRVVRGQHQVIATGGGAVMDPKNRLRLRSSGPVVCLEARPKVILERIGRRLQVRPLLAGAADPLARIKQLLHQRAAAYAQADLTVDTSDLPVDALVEQLMQKLGPYLCQGWQFVSRHAAELAQRYGGRYIVVAGQRIVGCGATQLEAYNTAQRLPATQETGIYYIPLPEESLTAL